MLSLIYGNPGSGKTTKLIEKLVSQLSTKREAIVIVSDQDAVRFEKLAASSAPDEYLMSIDVLSFRRLANRVFREKGGIALRYIGKGGKLLLLLRTVNELSSLNSLQYYKNLDSCDTKTISVLLEVITELQRMAITPSVLSALAEKAQEAEKENGHINPSFIKKINDISLIWSVYLTKLSDGSWDDSEEDLVRLCKMLDSGGNDFFADKDVYIDSFSGFSGQEYEVLRRILKYCPNVTITIGKLPKDERESALRLQRFENRIINIAKSEGVKIVREETLCSTRSQKSALAFIENHYFSYDNELCDSNEGLEIVECDDSIQEVSACAKAILKYIQNPDNKNARFRDCTVTMRNSDDYAGMIEGVFSSHNIPFYFAKKTDLASMSLCRLVFCALNIKKNNWRADDVIAFLKCGLCDIEKDDAFLIEKYITTWNIEGRKRYEEQSWEMNPKGYSDTLDKDTSAQLQKLEQIKTSAFAPLFAFCDSFDSKERKATVESISSAVYKLICDLRADEKIKEMAKEADEAGNNSKAQEILQSWDAMMLCLDEMVISQGDLEISCAKFTDILKILIFSKNISTIPTSQDQVTVSDAYNLRSNDTKNLYVLGMNDEVFPSFSTPVGLFSDSDIALAEKFDLDLPGSQSHALEDEAHILFNTLTSGRDSLTLYFHDHSMSGEEEKRSNAIDALKALFPNSEIKKYEDMDIDDKLYGRNSCIEYAFLPNEAGKALFDYYKSQSDVSPIIEMTSNKESENTLTAEAVNDVYKKDMYLSQSKINTFVNCPFSYSCKYLLKLDEDASNDIQASDVGTILHFILEKALRGKTGYANKRRELNEKEIISAANEAIREYKESIFGKNNPTTRMEQLFRRMRKLAKILLKDLCDEFNQSEFVPIAFELPIGKEKGKDGVSVDAIKIPLDKDNKENAIINGYCDRVDAYREGNDVYLRIIDYKTSDHSLKEEDLKLGLNAQMLLYMKAMLGNQDEKTNSNNKLLSDLGIINEKDNVKIHPAAMLYYIAKPQEKEDANGIKKQRIPRKGYLINDIAILEKMEKNLEGCYIQAKKTKKGPLSASGNILDEKDFVAALDEMVGTVAEIARRMKTGDCSISPLNDKNHDGCKYCKMRSICRIEDNSLSSDDDEDSSSNE